MKRFSLSLVTLVFLAVAMVGCGGSTTPDVPKPRAVVTIVVSPDPFAVTYSAWTGLYTAAWQTIFSETAGVGVTLTTVEMKFYNGAALLQTITAAGGSLPARGTLVYASSFAVDFDFTEMRLSGSGVDANGYSINVSRSFYWALLSPAGTKLNVKR